MMIPKKSCLIGFLLLLSGSVLAQNNVSSFSENGDAIVRQVTFEKCDLHGFDLFFYSMLGGTCELLLRVEGHEELITGEVEIKMRAYEFIHFGYQTNGGFSIDAVIQLPPDRAITVKELFGEYDESGVGASSSLTGAGISFYGARNEQGIFIELGVLKLGNVGAGFNSATIDLQPKFP
ncbi:MAG: hypothetical protein SGJ18_14020 [Pseudomonadota bacterium]|nr:hypothetical protein [Pseudomonadota bacterium]